MDRIRTLPGAESVAAAVALRNLKSYSENAMKHLFAAGCMVIPGSPGEVDPHSNTYVRKHFYCSTLKKNLRALRTAKTAAAVLIKHMEYINNGDGDPEQGRLPVWLQYSANQSHPNHVVSMMSPW